MGVTRLSRRVIARLAQAEACEPNLHYRDDLQIAKLTVLYASTGEAVYCAPDVLATYNVLGCHPDKVWSKIERQREALGDPEKVSGGSLPPKKPPQSAVGFSHVKLWCENTNAARELVAPRGANAVVLREPTISVPMAAPSIAALYPNPDDSSSAKKRQFTYAECIRIVRHSYVRASIRRATLNALTAMGPWPKYDGPISGVICVSLDGMCLGDEQGDGQCSRRTAQRRAKLACDLQYWRLTHKYNRWLPCPKCGTERSEAKCPKPGCEHRGRSRNRDGSTNTKEFCRPYTFEIDIHKFLTEPPPKCVRHFCARTWKAHQEAARRGEHPNVAEWPKQSQPEPAAPAKPQEPIRRTAEHRNVGRPLTVKQRKELSDRIESYQQGRTAIRDVNGYIVRPLQPGSPEYIKPLPREAAILAACQSMARGDPDRGFEGEGVALQRAREAAMEMEESS